MHVDLLGTSSLLSLLLVVCSFCGTLSYSVYMYVRFCILWGKYKCTLSL